jgi:hypothetical protein
MSNPVANFIAAVSAVFPKPKFTDDQTEETWHTIMARTLLAFQPDVISEACSEILETRGMKREERWFPLPAEVRAVCIKIAERKRMESPRMALAVDTSPDLAGTPERLRLADELIRGELGQRAAREGWILALREFCARHARLPREAEIHPLQRIAADFRRSMDEVDRLLQRAEDRRDTTMLAVGGALRRLGNTFAARSEELKGKALGKKGAA